MNTEENKRVVHELFARISRGDLDGMLALLSDDVNWWIAGELEGVPAAGDHDKKQVAGILASMHQQLKGNLRLSVHSLTAEDERVCAQVSGHGELNNGRLYRNQYHFLIGLEGGKIVSVREYLDTKHVEKTWFSP
ncbi:nuclear transport factor 2 family protein [Dyella choica]|uniref:Nuclear transport factor 2 family protein n=1 Tax=Dyella choica TaxID=1927959 RepID=A0A3S0Q268_9GAMM|nr:nuclear transport factor 2 family protein [Dyella choica]RUL70178.1 nuclear transport factor 2 family protein [Dyella choica]